MQKYRKSSDYSYALGTELTLQLLTDHPDKVRSVYIHSRQNDNEICRRIEQLARDNHIEVIRNDRIFNILSDKENCYIMALFDKYQADIDPTRNHVVLVNPANTGNLGTIIRTSIGFGIKDIAIISPGVDIFDPRTIRASMGAFFQLRFTYFDSFEEYLKKADERKVFTFMLDGARQLDEIEIPEKYSLVFGNEARGLDPEYQHYGQSVLIRHYPVIDSLNLCNAVSIALYEFTKGKIK
ncbi:MAG: TrmH family RNA methyltransferase [Erysipelotrichaceae bacterium]|nr:TrmH family RNA methyltransferase [Erysipelotrichaceae bacterium]